MRPDSDIIMIEVDGQEPISFQEFYSINTDPMVNAPTEEEFDRIYKLKVGEEIETGGAGSVTIKRVA